MSFSQKQVTNTTLYMIPVIVGNLIPILTLPIFTRILSVEDYGVYALSLVYAIFVTGVANFGLIIGYERNFFESKDVKKIGGLLYATVLFVFIALLFFGVITFLTKDFLSKKIIGSEKYGYLLFWSYCSNGVMTLKTYFLTYFKNTENAKSYVWYSVDETLIGVIFSFFFVAYLRIGVMGLIWGQLVGSSMVLVLLLIKFKRMLPFNLDLFGLKNSLKLSLPLTSRIFFGVINSQFDKYMIGVLGSLGGVGIYNFGQKIGNISFTFMTAIQNVYSPQVYRRMFEMGEEGKTSIGKYLTPFFYFSIAGSFLLALFCEELIILLTPKSYHGAIDVVSILCLLYGTYFFGKQPQLVYAKKTGLISLITLLTILLNIFINLPLIKMWGYMGAAYGTLTAGLISGIISFMLCQKYYTINWEFRKIGLILFLFFIATLCAIILREFDIDYLYRFIFKIISLIIYIVIGINFKIITPDIFSFFSVIFRYKR